MAAISQVIFSNGFSLMKNFYFEKKKSLKMVPESPIDNNLALV